MSNDLRPKYGTPALKMGRASLPRHDFTMSEENKTALKDYLLKQNRPHTIEGSLKTASPNIILDSEMVLTPTTLSAFFEKIAVPSQALSVAPKSAGATTSNSQTTTAKQQASSSTVKPANAGMQIKPARELRLAPKSGTEYGKGGNMGRTRKGSSLGELPRIS
jgi:hypothetical protein